MLQIDSYAISLICYCLLLHHWRYNTGNNHKMIYLFSAQCVPELGGKRYTGRQGPFRRAYLS